MRNYYIYIDHPVPHIRIHYADCSFCNAGNGIHKKTSGKNSNWFGPFESLEQAQNESVKLGKENGITDIQNCEKCFNS